MSKDYSEIIEKAKSDAENGNYNPSSSKDSVLEIIVTVFSLGTLTTEEELTNDDKRIYDNVWHKNAGN